MVETSGSAVKSATCLSIFTSLRLQKVALTVREKLQFLPPRKGYVVMLFSCAHDTFVLFDRHSVRKGLFQQEKVANKS